MARIVTLWVLLCLSAAMGMDYTARINQVSSSAKTIVIDKGLNDRVDTDDYGVLLIKDRVKNQRTGAAYTVYKPVAKIKAVKAFANSSIWIAYKTFIPEALKKDAKLLLLSETALLSGRTKLKIDNRKVVGAKGEIARNLKETLVDDGDFLANKSGDYQQNRVLHDKEKLFDSDITLIDLDVWEQDRVEGEYSYQGFYESPHAEVFADRMRVHRFEKMAAMFLKKFNDPKFTLQGLLAEQKRDENFSIFQDRTLRGSAIERTERDKAFKRQRDEKFFQDLLAKGESWSDDYSDEELGELMYNVGVVREKERRDVFAAQHFDYQIYGSFGLNLVNNENLEDRENTQQSKYDLEGAFEWYFFKEIQELKRFSLELSLRRSNDAFSTGVYNATSVEYSGGAHFNWYPFYTPNTLERNIVYLGILFRYGWARHEIESLGEKGNYQILSFPGFRGGVKYNFNNGYGLRLSAGLENIISDRLVRTSDEGELPDRIDHLEGKLSIGLSRFF